MASGSITSWQINGETVETARDFILGGSKITANGDCSHEIKTPAPWKKSYDQPRQHIKKQRHFFANKRPSGQSYGFSSSHVWMWELDYNESWAPRNWYFWPVVLEKTLFFKVINLFYLEANTLQYYSGFSHTLTWISHRCTCVPHPEPPPNLPPYPIPQRHPSTLALSILTHALIIDWWSISHMVINVFQCYSLKSSHPHLLPPSPKVSSLALCLFCCLTYRVIITIFLNSIIMH